MEQTTVLNRLVGGYYAHKFKEIREDTDNEAHHLKNDGDQEMDRDGIKRLAESGN